MIRLRRLRRIRLRKHREGQGIGDSNEDKVKDTQRKMRLRRQKRAS